MTERCGAHRARTENGRLYVEGGFGRDERMGDVVRARLAEAAAGVLIDARGAAAGCEAGELIAEGETLGRALSAYGGRCAIIIDAGDANGKVVGAVAHMQHASLLVTESSDEALRWLDGTLV